MGWAKCPTQDSDCTISYRNRFLSILIRNSTITGFRFLGTVQYCTVLKTVTIVASTAIVTVLGTVQYCTVPEKRNSVVVLFRIEIEKNRFRYEIVQLLSRVGHLAHPSPMVQSSTLKSRYSDFRTGLYQKIVLVTNQQTDLIKTQL